MNYSTFSKELPELYGQITVNGKSKIGAFKAQWHSLTNSMMYLYHTHKGNKGEGGFTLNKAFILFQQNRLSLNPKDGNPANYL